MYRATTWDKVAHDFNHDIHFASVGGIGGIADTCQLYRALSIPVTVIADLDLLRELDCPQFYPMQTDLYGNGRRND